MLFVVKENCLTADKMTHFTMLQTATKIRVPTTMTINVFYSYRMPWKKSENNIYERQMVECSDCSEWFSQNVWTNPRCCFPKKMKMRLVVLSVLAEKSWNYMYLNNMRSYIKFNVLQKKFAGILQDLQKQWFYMNLLQILDFRFPERKRNFLSW